MIRVFYSDSALYIDGVRQAIVARSLVASASGNTISISPLNATSSLAVLASGDFSIFAREDGSSFASVDEAMAYLAGQFAMRRPLGFVFTQGVPATSWQITHDLGFFANVIVLDTTGEETVGNVAYPDINTMTISFGQPASGTAYLS